LDVHTGSDTGQVNCLPPGLSVRRDIAVLGIEDIEAGVIETVLGPLPVGPVTNIIPWGLAQVVEVELTLERLIASASIPSIALDGRGYCGHLSADPSRQVLDPEVDGAVSSPGAF